MKPLLKALAMTAAAAFMATSVQAEKLVLLHTNDTHSQIDPFKDDDLGGVARRKVLIDSVRNVEDNVLLIDAGDAVQGTLFFNLYKGEVEEKLMNALGYDLRILGNHEFDNGMEKLAQTYGEAEADLLCSNYNFKETPLRDRFAPYSLYKVDGKYIAFMPINLQPEGMISSRNTQGMGYLDEIEAANGLAWYLKNIVNADMVVALTHIGYEADTALIAQSKDIDLLIGGHSHTIVDPQKPDARPWKVKNAEGREIVVAQAGKGGKYLGEIVIDLDSLGTAMPQSRLIKVDKRLDNQVDGSIEAIVAPYRAEVEELYHKPVATAPKRLDKEDPELLNFMADFVLERGSNMGTKADMSIINKGGIRNSIEKGTVTEGDIITVMPFFNRVTNIEVLGKDLIEAFNVMAAQDGNGVSKNVSATYDPDTDECIEILISGKPIDPDRKYNIATIDYLAEGGDYMEPLTRGKVTSSSDSILFEDMISYLKSKKNYQIKPDSAVRMKPSVKTK